jgi:hypothetical protein
LSKLRVRWAAVALAALVLTLSGVLVASADTNHGRPSCEGQLNELGFGSRDGWDHTHLANTAVFGSLAELEGYLNVCRTNDSVVVEAVSGSARGVRVSGVVRLQLRAILQRFHAADPDGAGPLVAGWNSVATSASVNTGVNRTLTVTTPTLNDVGSTPAHDHGWHRVQARALQRYSNGQLIFTAHNTYAVWLGDGPVSPAVPPA